MTGFHGTGPDDEAAADAMGRELDAVASKSPMMPTPDFTDRVMAAVAAEPPPRPVAAFGARGHGGQPAANAHGDR